MNVHETEHKIASSSRTSGGPARRSSSPALSVVMPVHNALPYLDEAIESILSQTYSDFEFVILDDASTDGSAERLAEWAERDPRIRFISAEHNLGPALSSQRVANEASAPIVARMDADDISLPNRIAEQVAVLEQNPGVGVVGGLYDIIDDSGRIVRRPEQRRLFRRAAFPPFGNGPLMYRREIFDKVGGYRKACEFWEDQDLIIRMAAITKVMVIPHSVYRMRQSPTSTRVVSEQGRLEQAIDLMYRSRAAFEHSGNYEAVLTEPNLRAKVDPRVFIALGSITLWAGGRPRLFKRFLERARLSSDFTSFCAFVWTGWASLSPSTLRIFMRLLVAMRNASGPRRIATDAPVYWSPLGSSR